MATAAMEAAGAAAATANAIRASGVLVWVKPEEFSKILARARDPLVVMAKGGIFSTKYEYLMSYKGLAFYCKSGEPLTLASGVEVVLANSMMIPG
jgi:hypothetical protein